MPESLQTKLVKVRDYIETTLVGYIEAETGTPHDRVEDLNEEEQIQLAQQMADKIRVPRDPVPGI